MQTRRNLVKSAALAAGAALVPAAALAQEAAEANRVCAALGIEKPVVQAIMNDLTSPQMAAAISEAGGLGVIALPTLELLQEAKALTSKPICAHTYIVDDETIAMFKEAGIEHVLVNGGAEAIAQLKAAGFKVVVKFIAVSGLTIVDEVLELQEAGADAVAVVGWGAGGCGPYYDVPATALIPELKAAGITVPLMVGGGVVDKATAAAGAAAGGEGAYVGTRFLVMKESACHPDAQQVIIDTNAAELIKLPIAYGLVHCNPSAMALEAQKLMDEGISTEDLTDFTGTFFELWHSMHLGTHEEWGVGMSNAVNLITSVKTAQEIVDDIAAGFGL